MELLHASNRTRLLIRYSILFSISYYSLHSPAGEEALLRRLKIYGVEMSVGLFEKGKLLRGCVANGEA